MVPLAYNGLVMIRRIVLILPVLLALALPALAQSAVTLRTGKHDDYTRAVFDWPQAVTYEVRETGPGELEIRFKSRSSLAMGPTEHGSGSSLVDVKQISGEGEDLAVSLKIADGSNFRHFMVGSRVVVDVFNPSGMKTATAPKPAPQAAQPPAAEKPAVTPPQKQPEKQPEKTFVPAPKTAAADPAPPQLPAVKPAPVETETMPPEQVEEKTAIEQATPLDPHVITLTATETLGLAAFIRFDHLWLVVDRSTVNVAPQVGGAQAAQWPPFERFELKGGAAYRVKLPPEMQGANFYGEGGGLVWRIVMTPNRRDVKPVEMKRAHDPKNPVRGGAVSWPLLMTTNVLEVPDPEIGDILKVVTVAQADQFVGEPQSLIDFNVLRSIVGLALQPKVDDLKLNRGASGVEAGRPGGLALSPVKDVSRSQIREQVREASIADEPPAPGEEIRRIFDFDRWMMGGLQALEENQRILLADMAAKDKNGRVEDLLTLAKMNLSNDRGQEAVGFISYAAAELPAIADSPEVRALYGASAALAGKFELAFRELFHPTLTPYTELDYWRAYTLASLEDWQQAVEIMPDDFTVLVGYPRPLFEKIGLKLAEVSLRSGDVQTAEGILAVLQKERETLKPWAIAAMDYLKGEAHRQSKEFDQAKQWWEPLSTGKDDLHRAKAGLALTMLQLENGDITTEQAIDRLEGLRYAWRGDELEAQINFLVGKLYLQQDLYMKGFTILRDAASMSPDSDIGREITTFMRTEFHDLLVKDQTLSPVDAVEVYEEFRELTPSGEEGNVLVQKLAERLVQADLLNRAAAILEHQVDYRLGGTEKGRVAVRLGAIHLLDRNARQAMKYLDAGREVYAAALTGDERAAKLKEIDLLRARGLSQLNRTEEAIDLLRGFEPTPTTNRLRADIAWQAGLWEDAAEALQDLVLDEALDLNRPLTPEQADLLLNHAVALNLSGNRVALNTARTRYQEAMKKTARARLYEIVTRPRKTAIMADKETIESIVKEVDMFQDFLKTYKQDAAAVSN